MSEESTRMRKKETPRKLAVSPDDLQRWITEYGRARVIRTLVGQARIARVHRRVYAFTKHLRKIEAATLTLPSSPQARKLQRLAVNLELAGICATTGYDSLLGQGATFYDGVCLDSSDPNDIGLPMKDWPRRLRRKKRA